MQWFKRQIIRQMQRINRRFNSAYLELVYQASYLDTASRTKWLTDVPLASPRGGSASFSLLYVLLTILRTQRFESILELGSGLSTSLFLQYVLATGGKLTSVENDLGWYGRLPDPSPQFNPIFAELEPVAVDRKELNWYGLDTPKDTYDLVLVDGPASYSRSTQNNRLGILQWFPDILEREFIIIVDDTGRTGEALLVGRISRLLDAYGIGVVMTEITGGSSHVILASKGFEDLLSL